MRAIGRGWVLPILFGLLAGAIVLAQDVRYVPEKGFVPDEKTAIAITEAILTPIFGQEQVALERPFHASLDEGGVWTIRGSMPKGWMGGVAEVRIQKRDGRILSMEHGK